MPIYFDYDRSDVKANQRGPLADNAKAIEADGGIARVIIEGHCDERGTNEYNMALGQRRADSVKNYFVNYGIPKTKLSTVSYGEDRPVDPGHTEEAWARNRRAEFIIQK
ncbi:peptidoglycan-associated lipoprotein Pal [Candidatus Fermentibacteria bacterium]|nr:peptidoglycan-associated lipoprotein Pal [Candidatus Fermentibacteria bacterium]